eukprot:scpid21386/ scgid16741/ 
MPSNAKRVNTQNKWEVLDTIPEDDAAWSGSAPGNPSRSQRQRKRLRRRQEALDGFLAKGKAANETEANGAAGVQEHRPTVFGRICGAVVRLWRFLWSDEPEDRLLRIDIFLVSMAILCFLLAAYFHFYRGTGYIPLLRRGTSKLGFASLVNRTFSWRSQMEGIVQKVKSLKNHTTMRTRTTK